MMGFRESVAESLRLSEALVVVIDDPSIDVQSVALAGAVASIAIGTGKPEPVIDMIAMVARNVVALHEPGEQAEGG
jgi:hypothetical protein